MKSNLTKSMDLFDFDDTGRVIHCPHGHIPEKTTQKQKKDRYVACFAIDCCQSWQKCADLPVAPGSKFYYLRYIGEHYRLSEPLLGEFIERYRWRSGIEATMSEYARLTSVKRLRVRGMAAVRYCARAQGGGPEPDAGRPGAAGPDLNPASGCRSRVSTLTAEFFGFQRAICWPGPKIGRSFSSKSGSGRRRPCIGRVTFCGLVKEKKIEGYV
jgi:hypothetical protein